MNHHIMPLGLLASHIVAWWRFRFAGRPGLFAHVWTAAHPYMAIASESGVETLARRVLLTSRLAVAIVETASGAMRLKFVPAFNSERAP